MVVLFLIAVVVLVVLASKVWDMVMVEEKVLVIERISYDYEAKVFAPRMDWSVSVRLPTVEVLDVCVIDHNGKVPYTWDCCEVICYSNRSYPKGSIGALLSVFTYMDGDVYPRVHYEVGYWSGSEAISCCQDGYAVCCETSNVNVVEFLFPVLYRAMLAEAKEMRIASRRRTQRAYEQDEFTSRPYCAKVHALGLGKRVDQRAKVLNKAKRQGRAIVAQAKGR